MKIKDLLLERVEQSPYEVFSQYSGNKNMFVTYTTRPRVYLNTTPKFETPFGLYTYPLDYVLWKAKNGSLFNVTPFAGNRKHISLIEKTSNRVVDLAKYSGYYMDIDKLEEYTLDNYGDDVWDEVMFDYTPRGSDGKKMWGLVTILSNRIAKETGQSESEVSRDIFTKILGWDGAIDNGAGAIHSDEPTQTVFFYEKSYRVLKTMENK